MGVIAGLISVLLPGHLLLPAILVGAVVIALAGLVRWRRASRRRDARLRAIGRPELPETLHGQLFLLAYDRRRNRLDGENHWPFGLALRAAMLADLYLTGHLQDRKGRPDPVGDVAPPVDPLLRAVLDGMGDNTESWAQVAARGSQRDAAELVRSQLEMEGWLWAQRRRMLGIIPSTRLRLRDDEPIGDLAGQVSGALRYAIDGRPADERLLAVGPLGVLGQLPTVYCPDDTERHLAALQGLVDRAIPPITGMREVIDTVHRAMRAHTSFFSEGP